ncbi:MAG: 50S ribosomal protein L18 [Candidatus Marinimicrobia bacterium]|nr:50S ribosomal protein L18 [Candidatus Neomarinimicrobiota bacterium]|tara:strand:- start:7716 stop:8087 length:372 start_codon:yes stop_codon:yes gene_type:complete
MGIFNNNLKRKRRRRNRSKGTSMFHPEYPRLVVYRSNKHFESQIVNDFEGQTIISSSSRDKNLKNQIDKSKNKTDLSIIVGKSIAKLAKKKKISKVVFDRNGYPFHGRVKAFADAAREEGLEF